MSALTACKTARRNASAKVDATNVVEEARKKSARSELITMTHSNHSVMNGQRTDDFVAGRKRALLDVRQLQIL